MHTTATQASLQPITTQNMARLLCIAQCQIILINVDSSNVFQIKTVLKFRKQPKNIWSLSNSIIVPLLTMLKCNFGGQKWSTPFPYNPVPSENIY